MSEDTPIVLGKIVAQEAVHEANDGTRTTLTKAMLDKLHKELSEQPSPECMGFFIVDDGSSEVKAVLADLGLKHSTGDWKDVIETEEN